MLSSGFCDINLGHLKSCSCRPITSLFHPRHHSMKKEQYDFTYGRQYLYRIIGMIQLQAKQHAIHISTVQNKMTHCFVFLLPHRWETCLLQLPSSSFLVDVAINLAFECHHHMTKLYHYEILITGHHHTMFLSLP